MTREWHSAAELAGMRLPGLPHTRQGIDGVAEAGDWLRPAWRGVSWRPREGRGGGVEFHVSVLPAAAQAALLLRQREEAAPPTARGDAGWAWFERLPAAKQAAARTRLEALEAVVALTANGIGRVAAMQEVARLRDVRLSTLYAWAKLVEGRARADWLPALAPHHAGRSGDRVECSPEAWEMLRADFLRPEQPSFAACHRRLLAVAAQRGWQVPAARTLERRLADIPEAVRVLARGGTEALKRMMPAQQRDRAALHALQLVNADGHTWDVFVRWPDGSIGRPVMLAFQDVYSGKILSWRVDRSENRETFRLCFGDLVEQWGIPDACVLDNSRTFASKWMTGGAPNRFRFKVREDEPLGIMTELGIAIHWATPYHGQAKPIERAFRDFAGDVAKHPAFAGAYTGNSPAAKPANHGSASVPLPDFLAVIGREIIAHNARAGRTGGICHGRSFDDVWAESYARAPIRHASAAQRRLWLLAAERQLASRTDGSLTLLGNRYWAAFLHGHRGERLTVRFDPAALHAPLHVYRGDGAYLGAADCIEAVGFLDAGAARRHAQAQKALLRGVRMQLEAERTLSIRDVAALLPDAPAPAPVERKIIRPVFGNTALQPTEAPADGQPADDAAFVRAMRRLHVVRGDLGDRDD